jgi:hypothetical protein
VTGGVLGTTGEVSGAEAGLEAVSSGELFCAEATEPTARRRLTADAQRIRPHFTFLLESCFKLSFVADIHLLMQIRSNFQATHLRRRMRIEKAVVK